MKKQTFTCLLCLIFYSFALQAGSSIDVPATGSAPDFRIFQSTFGWEALAAKADAPASSFSGGCVSPGSIVITEIMQNPNVLDDGEGEWIEVYNTTAAPIDLMGWILKDDDNEADTITMPAIVMANSYAILARNLVALSTEGVTGLYQYDSFFLSNSSDEIILICGGVEIDRVNYDNGATFPDPSGASMSLNPDSLNANANNSGSNWCVSTTSFGSGDTGTPGAANDMCIAGCTNPAAHNYNAAANLDDGSCMTCTDGVMNGDETGVDCGGTNPACPASCASCGAVGSIVITEIMQNPSIVGDADGEWIEVYNTTAAPVDLVGWTLSDDGSDTHTITSSAIVPANGYAVLARNSNAMANGGVTAIYQYSGFQLANGDDEVVLSCGMTEIDRVNYDGGPGFPDPNGASMSLNPDSLNANANNNGASWCASSSTFGSGDSGTPAAANDACPGSCPAPSQASFCVRRHACPAGPPILIDWADVPGAVSYMFHGERNNATGTPQLNQTVTNSGFTFNGVVPNNFGVRINLTSVCADGSTSSTGLFQYTISDANCANCPVPSAAPIDISELSEVDLSPLFVRDSKASIYPNPTKGVLHLNYVQLQPQAQAEIIDVFGKIHSLLQLTDPTMRIDVSELSAGIYFLRIHDGHSRQLLRFIKN